MCGTCTTLLDAAATNSVLVAAWATNRFRSRRAARAGLSATDQAVARWQEQADFVGSLGLDPWTTLGAPPAPPLFPAGTGPRVSRTAATAVTVGG